MRRHAGDDARIGIETGGMTPWLVHELRNLGLEVVCLDARHARAALKMQINKTDQNDAEGLAQIVRTGWYRAVHVKSFGSHRARALLGARAQLVGMTTRLSNHIRGVLKTFGLLPGPMRGFDRKVEALLLDRSDVALLVRPMLVAWRQLREQVVAFDERRPLIKDGDYTWDRPALLQWKLRKLELKACHPSRRGGKKKGSAAAYSNKSVRDSERETIGNAEEEYRRFVAT